MARRHRGSESASWGHNARAYRYPQLGRGRPAAFVRVGGVSVRPPNLVEWGMTEHIALRLDWNDVKGDRVTNILGQHAQTTSDGSMSWDAVTICIAHRAICLSVEADTDQIEVSLGNARCGDGWEPIPSFSFAVGQPLGWCWVGVNSQGYKDSFTLAFGDVVPAALEPRCLFLAEGSSLICFDLSPRRP